MGLLDLFGKKDYLALGADAYQAGQYKKAVSSWGKAAKQGNADAKYYMGICYEKGQGVEVDLGKAFDLFLESAQSGNVKSQYKTGTYYEEATGVLREVNC